MPAKVASTGDAARTNAVRRQGAVKKPIAQFIADHEGWLWLLARRLSRRTGLELEDTLSVIRLRAILSYHTFDPAMGAGTTWLAFVARTAVDHHLTVAGHHNVQAVSFESIGELEDGDRCGWEALFADPRECDPAEEAASREVVTRVRAAVASLPLAQRRAVRKHLRGEDDCILARNLAREESAVLRAGFDRLRESLFVTANQL